MGKHKGTDWTKFDVLHYFSNYMDPVSMQCRVDVELAVEKRNDQFLDFL